MIDVTTERMLDFSEAAKLLPKKGHVLLNGKGVLHKEDKPAKYGEEEANGCLIHF